MFNNYTTEKPYESCNVILPETEQTGALLIGDFNSATDPETLHKHGIKTVITAATGLDHLEIPSFVTHITYPLTDAKSEKIHQYFDHAFQTIDQNLKHGGVLVHCAAGVSRSASLVIAYLMRKRDWSFKAAIQFVRKYRSGVCPNLGFELQLKEYEKELGNSAPPIKKNVSERLTDSVNLSQSYSSKNKKIQNYSVFSFEPVHSINSTMKKKIDPKKTVSKAFGLSKPKQKIGLGIGQAELFVAGKAAKRTASEAKHGDKKKTSKNLLMETWGISLQKGKQF